MIHNYNMILLQYCCPRKCKYFLSVAMYEILDGFTRFLKMCKYKLLASVLHMYTFVIVRVCVYACLAYACIQGGWVWYLLIAWGGFSFLNGFLTSISYMKAFFSCCQYVLFFCFISFVVLGVCPVISFVVVVVKLTLGRKAVTCITSN